MSETDFGNQGLETIASDNRCPRMALILIDDNDVVLRPAQIHGALHQIVLASFTACVVAYLNQCGLANVDKSLAFKMIRLDFWVVESIEHCQAPS